MAAKRKTQTLAEMAKEQDLTLRDYMIEQLLRNATPEATAEALAVSEPEVYEAMNEADIWMFKFDFRYVEDKLISSMAYIPREVIPAGFLPVAATE